MQNETLLNIHTPDCAQSCVFCESSLRRPGYRRELSCLRNASYSIEEGIARAPGAILFAGDDCLAHPQICHVVGLAAAKGHPVSVIGPPPGGDSEELARGLIEAGLSAWNTAFLGCSPEEHDAVAGRPGAFEQLMALYKQLIAGDVAVNFLCPVIRPLLDKIPAIADKVHREFGQRLTLLRYVPDGSQLELDKMVPRHEALRQFFLGLEVRSVQTDTFPLCLCPEGLRSENPHRFPEPVYPELCSTCGRRSACSGLSPFELRAVGSEGLAPL